MTGCGEISSEVGMAHSMKDATALHVSTDVPAPSYKVLCWRLSAQKFMWLVYGCLFATQVVNAGYTVITKIAISGPSGEGVNPLVFSMVRDAIAYPILHIAALALDGPTCLNLEDVPRIFVTAVTGIFANQFFFILGLQFINPTLASVLNQFQPICACVLAVSIGFEMFAWAKVAGVLLAVAGAVIMVGWNFGSSSGTQTLIGTGAVLLSVLALALYYIIQKPLLSKYKSLTLTAYAYLFATLIMGAASLFYFPWTTSWWIKHSRHAWRFPSSAWIALAYAVVMNSVLKYSLQTFCNHYVTVTVIAAFCTLQAFFVGILSAIFHVGQLEWRYFAAVLVFAGLGVILWVKEKDGEYPPKRSLCLVQLWLRQLIGGVPMDAPDHPAGAHSVNHGSSPAADKTPLLPTATPSLSV